MNTRALRRTGLIAGALTTSALVLAGCAGGSGGAATADPNEKVELTVATFNDFGYTDALLADTANRIAVIRASMEGREGVASFLEKRKPTWLN